MFDKDMKVNLL